MMPFNHNIDSHSSPLCIICQYQSVILENIHVATNCKRLFSTIQLLLCNSKSAGWQTWEDCVDNTAGLIVRVSTLTIVPILLSVSRQ